MVFYRGFISLGLSFILFIFSTVLTWYVGSNFNIDIIGTHDYPLGDAERLSFIDLIKISFNDHFLPYPLLMIVSFAGILCSTTYLIIKRKKLLV
jgi:hypothetical protein